jgi:DNA-binding CsgD family transcriptional regulator
MALVGRNSEREAIEALVVGALAGSSGVLVLRGDAGVGKTAILDDAAESAAARGMRVARMGGIESETQLGYAALHSLLLPYWGHVELLPDPQRDALKGTFGLVAGPPADRFMVALAVLTLLADVATEEPLLCLVDDGHWLDPETRVVLGFVARRLHAERVAMVLATRDLQPLSPSGALPALVIGSLDDSEAADLLSSVSEGTVSPQVADRVVASAGGNPLVLVELARELTPEQLSGLSPVPEPLPVGRSLQAVFSRQLRRLPTQSRLLLALAATEPGAPQATLWRAAAQLGIDPDLAASELEDLVAFTPRVTFRHPLVCSVAYHLTPLSQRRLLHRALADQGEEPDRVAWHLGLAAAGPDEAVAARLEEMAERARQRGGYAATVTFLARAAELSLSDDLRTRRLLASAEAALTAGQPVQARALLDKAESGPTSDAQMATVLRLGGEVAFATGQTADAARQLLAAAKSLMPIDAQLGRRTMLSALIAATYTRDDASNEVRAFAADLLETPVVLEDPSSTADCLLFGFLHRLCGESQDAVPLFRAAIHHLRSSETPDSIRIAVPTNVIVLVEAELMDDCAAVNVLNAYVRFARRTGALSVLAPALTALATVLPFRGRLNEAEAAWDEGRALGQATGTPGLPRQRSSFIELALLCWRGREVEARALSAILTAEEEPRAEDVPSPDWQQRWLALLELSLGRYRQAYDRLLPVFREDRLGIGTHTLPDVIEAAARCGELAVAREALSRLEKRAEASGAQWGLGRLTRCKALLGEDAAEPCYRQAIDLFQSTAALTDLARTHLLYGEWLRRQRRRRDARLHLGTAHEIFVEMGFNGFASRTHAELAATGERARKRSAETSQTFTPQETQVARLVAEGRANREVAAELFISPATVDYHLRKVYQKLGVTSRTQLARMMLTASLPGSGES